MRSGVAFGWRTGRLGRVFPTHPAFRQAGAALLLALATIPSTRAADGAAVYEANCAPCHGMDGKARTPAGRKLGAHDLSESKFDEATILRQIRDGVKSPQGADRMPAFKDRLKPEEISAVAEFVKTFRKK